MAGLASVVAQTCTQPVEVVKTRLQISGEVGAAAHKTYNSFLGSATMVARNEGFFGLYKGMSAAALREMSYSSLRFGLYEPFKRVLGESDAKHTPIWKKFASGAAAGIVGSGLANPTDVLKVRMMANEGEPKRMITIAKEVYADGGLTAFYRSVHTTMIRAAILNATKLAAYDDLKQNLLKHNIMQEGMPLHFCCSMFAGVMVAATTSPVDLVRTRLMNQPAGKKL
eukprot:762935-Hanusia_phi.AAC.3